MKLNEVTGRSFLKWELCLGRIPDDPDAEEFPAFVMCKFIKAAVEAGIAEDVPEDIAAGDIDALKPERVNLLLNIGVQIKEHISAALEPLSGEA
jgi:hypothetical protein